MVFKQWKTDINSLNQLFKQFGTNYGLFNKTFADIGNDFKNKHGLRSLTNLASKSDIANLNDYNKAIEQGMSYHKAYNTYMLKSSTVVQKQALEIKRLNIEQKMLNRQYKAGTINQQEYNTAMAANKAQIQALTTQTKTLTLAQKASAAASKALGVALNVALNVGLMLAINAIITGITKLVNRQKEQLTGIM